MDVEGKEVTCRRSILAAYARGKLVVDVFAMAPFHYAELFASDSGVTAPGSVLNRAIKFLRCASPPESPRRVPAVRRIRVRLVLRKSAYGYGRVRTVMEACAQAAQRVRNPVR